MKTNTLVVIILAVLVLLAITQTAQLFSIRNNLNNDKIVNGEIAQKSTVEAQKPISIIESSPEKTNNQKEGL